MKSILPLFTIMYQCNNQWTASPVSNNKCQRKAELWTKIHSNHLAVDWGASYASSEINAVFYDLFHIFWYIFNNRFHTRAQIPVFVFTLGQMMDTIASMTASPQFRLWQQHLMELLYTNVLYINEEVSLPMSSSHHIKIFTTTNWQPFHHTSLAPYHLWMTTITWK